MYNELDNYRRKQEADEAFDALKRHKNIECKGQPALCSKCRELEVRLELSRYIGE